MADDTDVQAGRSNRTSSAAQRNAESLSVVRNAPALAVSRGERGVAWRQQWIEGIEPPPTS